MSTPFLKSYVCCLIVFVLSLIVPAVLPAQSGKSDDVDPRRINHLLNRAAFGPSLSEVERIKRIGIDAWIEEQL